MSAFLNSGEVGTILIVFLMLGLLSWYKNRLDLQRWRDRRASQRDLRK